MSARPVAAAKKPVSKSGKSVSAKPAATSTAERKSTARPVETASSPKRKADAAPSAEALAAASAPALSAKAALSTPSGTQEWRADSAYLEIPVFQIEPSPYQARRVFAPEALRELAESIQSEGLLQPIVVRRVEDAEAGASGVRYQLVAGERRWRAFQGLNLKAIPARVVEAGDASSAALGLIENLQRDGLNPIEEAHGFASLIRDFDLTQEAAADRVGRSRASVANTLRLLSLDEELQGYLAKGLLSTGHAKVLLGVADSAQRALLARRVIEEGLSVRATERLVQELEKTSSAAPRTGGRAAKRGGAARDAEAVAAIEQKLTSQLGARVAVLHTPKKGRIVIEYHGNEDLQRVLGKLGVAL
ncbi:chromosome partitioning protein ParB [Cephaloticoccus capnophilus]|uniref:Chromosome partitioning protein ParB n=1 Tax=Cephaloticoccus capnophilus TaxID=1548208 RepID=A0A139STD7_9BACT|nr:chromosome partitioning protein ParB [Cephaloticoccus capnophilus]